MKKNFELIVIGKVQKVGLRFMSLKRAYELHIRGYVKYLDEMDRLAFEIEGEEENLTKFINWLKKGATFADINSIAVQEGEIKHYTTFEILQKNAVKPEVVLKSNKKRLTGLIGFFLG
jgi:acylphosphatase